MVPVSGQGQQDRRLGRENDEGNSRSGAKNEKEIFKSKCQNLLKLENMCLRVYSGLILQTATSVLDPPAHGTRGTRRTLVNVSLTDGEKSHKLHSRK